MELKKEKLISEILKEDEISYLNFNTLEMKKKIYSLIKTLNKKAENYPLLNIKKIIIIAIAILNETNRIKIKPTNTVILYTATIIWHSAIKRPGDKEYITQENIDPIFKRPISVAHYLRQELGVNQRTFKNLSSFLIKLRESETLKEKNKIDFIEISEKEYLKVKDIVINKIIGRVKASSAIECCIFLYFNNGRSFTKNQIYYAIRDKLNLHGATPRATFGSDISRYCDNSNAKKKRNPLLFTIINLEKMSHKIKLIREVREIIDDQYLEKLPKETINKIFLEKEIRKSKTNKQENAVWICPKDSCKNKKVKIDRTKSDLISGNTFEKVIIHFLQHLKQENVYFGSIDLYDIFSKYILGDKFTKEDLSSYKGDPLVAKWQTNLRSVLDRVLKNEKNYIETVEREKVPEKYNKNIKDKRRYRTRKRTEKFLNSFKIYDDWKLYDIKGENLDNKKFDENRKLNSLIVYDDNKLSIKVDISYLIPEISIYLKNLDIDSKRQYFISKGYNWRRKLNNLNLWDSDKKEIFFKNLKKEFKNINMDISDIQNIIDLKNHEMYGAPEIQILRDLMNMKFKIYKFYPLTEEVKMKYYNLLNNNLSDSIDLYKNESTIKKVETLNKRISKENTIQKVEYITVSIKKLNELLEVGLITLEEFESKKKELLERL